MKRISLLSSGLIGLYTTCFPTYSHSAPPNPGEISVLLQGPEVPVTGNSKSTSSPTYVADARMQSIMQSGNKAPNEEVSPDYSSETVIESEESVIPNRLEMPSDAVGARDGSEVVRDRYDNGKLRIERQVALDGQGNFVNHGRYQEWSREGDLLMQGEFEMGQRTGMWVRIHNLQEGGIFKSSPYNQFKPPFTSQVNFLNGQMHGEWIIRDAEGRVISEIQIEHGIRNGTAKWNQTSGVAMFEAAYKGGILDGAYVERDAKGTEISRSLFKLGQRIEVEREQYSNKRLKSEFHYLSAPQQLLTMDDWAHAKFATYDKQGDRIKHGAFALYFENGELKAKGSYAEGVLDGLYQSWHANGQLESQGTYRQGAQDGDWNWWHNNGMRQASGKYVDGRPAGNVLQWKPDGTRVDGSTAQIKPAAPTTNVPEKRQAMQRRVHTMR